MLVAIMFYYNYDFELDAFFAVTNLDQLLVFAIRVSKTDMKV